MRQVGGGTNRDRHTAGQTETGRRAVSGVNAVLSETETRHKQKFVLKFRWSPVGNVPADLD